MWTAGEPLHTGWVVLIEGNQIKAVGPKASVTAPPDAERIALPGMTVLPGLMDLHSHLFLHPYNEKLWDLPGADRAAGVSHCCWRRSMPKRR